MQTEGQNEGHEKTTIAMKCRTLYIDDMEPDCRDKVRVCLFFWKWGSGLAIFNQPMNVAAVVLEYLPSWKVTHLTDGFSCGAGMAYAPGLRFPCGREFQSGLQISRNSAESYDNVRRRMRPLVWMPLLARCSALTATCGLETSRNTKHTCPARHTGETSPGWITGYVGKQ